jgi:hypothetical protein
VLGAAGGIAPKFELFGRISDNARVHCDVCADLASFLCNTTYLVNAIFAIAEFDRGDLLL